MDLKELTKLTETEIFEYIINNPSKENEILNHLKLKAKDKFFKITLELKSFRLNSRGSAALKKNILETVTKDKSIILINPSLIKPNPNQPRKIFDEVKLKELTESIIEHGLLQPIVVVADKNDTYTLVAGERRLRAHKLANLPEIKAIVIDVDEEQATNLAIIENLHRDNLTPMEEGLSYLSLQKVTGKSYRDLEEIVIKDKNYIAARVNLTRFDDDCIDYILKHQLKNISKLTKILGAEGTVHSMLLEKLYKKDLTDEEIEKFYVDRIRKVPTPKVKDASDSKPKEIDHDKFDENPDFSKDKKVASMEAITEKILEAQNGNIENFVNDSTIVKQADSFLIKSLGNVINITIDKTKLTGNDLEYILEHIKSL